ncbi:MAG TPA: hypothetical protein QF353_04870 [Gammaproteobacteria bacterium]|nr:hypothetical protein [Gammaproteobacteria bacterium]
MDEVGKRMVSAEMSIEEMLVKFKKVKSYNAQLIKKNKTLESKQVLLQKHIEKLMARVKQALCQLKAGS